MPRPSIGLQFELVSTIAIFGIGILADGNLDTSWVGYKEYIGDDVAAITNAAHDKGVRVVPTFQLFDSGSLTKMRAFLASTAAQTRFITQALELMDARKADGANLDFEPMVAADTPAYLSFVSRFRTAMKARFPPRRSSTRRRPVRARTSSLASSRSSIGRSS